MSEWTHVLTIAVPELLIAQANQLALSFVTVKLDADSGQTITGNDSTKIRVVVDVEPFAALELLGLYRIEVAE